MIEDFHIVAVGARTPLGMNAESTAATVRSGIDQFSEHPFIIDKVAEPVILAMDSQLDSNLFGVKRMFRMALTALREVWHSLTKLGNKFDCIPIFLALPEYRPGWTEEKAQQLISMISGLLDQKKTQIQAFFPFGHAASLIAVQAATEYMNERNSQLGIVLGVDSYLELETLEWLDQNRQLSTSYHRGAFIPGEGAGAIAISCSSVVQQFQLPSYAKFNGIGISHETKLIKTDSTCLGEGLTDCIRQSLALLQSPQEKVQGIICDINGERYRTEEWGFALLRLTEAFVDPTDYDFPSTYWGDVGAASGVLFLILTIDAGAKNWAKGDRYLIWSSSEGGKRVAVYVELHNNSARPLV